MRSLSKFSVVTGVVAGVFASGVLSLPELTDAKTTCAPTTYTTAHVSTITFESVVTVPHSCFTFTVETPQATGCLTYACGPTPECVLQEKTTLYVPASDACCPTTTTTTTHGLCPTCKTGCATIWETVIVTTTPAVRRNIASTSTSSSAPCTQTIFRYEPLIEGPTKTIYPHTATKIAFEDCGGCEYLDVRNINGLGPVVIFTTTTFDPEPTTTTAYTCSRSPTTKVRDV